MADVEVSAAVTGMQSVLSEIDQLKQAIQSLSSMTGAGGAPTESAPAGGNFYAGDDPQVASAPPTSAGQARTPPGSAPPPVIPPDRANPHGRDPYSNIQDQNGELLRVQHGQYAMAASAVQYGTSLMGEFGLGQLGSGIQQLVAGFIDFKRLQARTNEILETIAAVGKVQAAEGAGAGGRGLTLPGGTPLPAGGNSSVPAETEGAAANPAAVGGFVGALSRVAAPLAIAYGVFQAARGGVATGDMYTANRAGGLVDRRFGAQEGSEYYSAYGAREETGFGTGMEEAAHFRRVAAIRREIAELEYKRANPLFGGGWAEQFDSMVRPVGRGIDYDLKLIERQNKLTQEDMAFRNRDVTSRTLRGFGVSGMEQQDVRFGQEFAESYGPGAAYFLNNGGGAGLTRGVSPQALSGAGLTQEQFAQNNAVGMNYLARNPGYSGGAENTRRVGQTGENRVGVFADLAMAFLAEGDTARAQQFAAQARAFNPNVNLDTFNSMANTAVQNTGYATQEGAERSFLQSERASLEALGGTRESIQANMAREGGMYGRRLEELRFRRTLTSNPTTLANLDSQIAVAIREEAQAVKAPVEYQYQTAELRNYLTGSEAGTTLGIESLMGMSMSSSRAVGLQGTSEGALSARIANLRLQASDPRMLQNPDQQRQLLLQADQMEAQLQASRRGYNAGLYGEAGARIGLEGARAGYASTVADLFGGGEERISAGFGMLGPQRSGIGLLQSRLADIDSGRQPASAAERLGVVDQLTQALARLTQATERAVVSMFDIPAQLSGMRQGIASAKMGAGLAFGAGGVGVVEEYGQVHAESASQVQIRENEVSALRARGYDENSTQMLSAKRQAAEARRNMYESGNAFASSPLSASTRETLAQNSFELGILNTLPGAIGSRKAVIGEQMDNLYMAEQEVLARRAAQMRTDGSNYTDESELAYKNELRGYQSQRVGLFNDLSFGWQQRLVSSAINAPGNFSTVLPGLAYRSAVAAGVRNPLFGSTVGEVPDFLAHSGILGSISGATATPIGAANTALTRGTPGNPMYVVMINGDDPRQRYVPGWRPQRPQPRGGGVGDPKPEANPGMGNRAGGL